MSDWIPRLMAEKVQLEQRLAIFGTENLHLRNQLAEARELLSHISCFVPERYEAEIDDWLERNKT